MKQAVDNNDRGSAKSEFEGIIGDIIEIEGQKVNQDYEDCRQRLFRELSRNGDNFQSDLLRCLLYLCSGHASPAEIESFTEAIAQHRDVIAERHASLPTIFENEYRNRVDQYASDPEGAGHYSMANLGPSYLQKISIRKCLGKLGVVTPFDESEYEESLKWLQKTVVLVLEKQAESCLSSQPSADDRSGHMRYDALLHGLRTLFIHVHEQAEKLLDETGTLREQRARIKALVIDQLERQYRDWDLDPADEVKKVDAAFDFFEE